MQKKYTIYMCKFYISLTMCPINKGRFKNRQQMRAASLPPSEKIYSPHIFSSSLIQTQSADKCMFNPFWELVGGAVRIIVPFPEQTAKMNGRKAGETPTHIHTSKCARKNFLYANKTSLFIPSIDSVIILIKVESRN